MADTPLTVAPRVSTCKDCGGSFYWAKMDDKYAGKFWGIDVEPNLEKGQIVLSLNAETGQISGHRLVQGESAPDGALLRMPHFMTCPARPAYDPEKRAKKGNPNWRNPKQSEMAGIIPSVEFKTKEEEAGLDLEDLPF